MVIRATKQKQRPTAPTPSVNAPPVPPVPDLAHSMQGIADVIFKALEAPLRAQVEACVQAIVQEATRDIHARIVAEIGRIQPINIPINLFAQTAPAAPITPPAAPVPAPAPVVAMPAYEVEDAPIDDVDDMDDMDDVDEMEEEVEVEVEEIEETAQEIEAVEEEIYDEEESPVEDVLPPVPESPPERQPAPIALAPAAPPRKNLSVTIVGLKPGQAHMIKSEFRFLKLHFISSDAGAGPQLKSLAKTNDYVVQMTDFIRHAVTDSVKSANGNGNWVYISGGMTKLREKLQELSRGHLNSPTAATAA